METYMGAGSYPRFGTHTVKVSLQWSEYKGEIVLKIGGNSIGASVLGCALDMLEDGDFRPDMQIESNQKHIRVVESGEFPGYPDHYLLYNETGDELIIDFVYIMENVTGVQIIDWEADSR